MIRRQRRRGVSKGKYHLGSGFPIGASSIPVGKGILKGNRVLLCLGCSEGIEFPFDRKNPKKPAVSWHTTFLGKSSVLYLYGADGSRNCSTPRKVRLQLRRSGGKGCPLQGSISDRKRLAGGAGKHCLSAVSCAPGGARFLRVKVPNPPGSGKDIAEGKGVAGDCKSEGSWMWGTY